MHLQRLAKDEHSYAAGGSQTMYLAENGMFGIQGIEADSDTLSNVENLIVGEGFVLIKPEIVIEAVRFYQDRLA